jgi:AbrB family looped-hinge helix DNA binding protein
MKTTRLSTKGQLILPKDVRDHHGWTAGTELEVEDRGDAVILREVEGLPESRLEEILGCAGYDGPARTLEEMETAIARGAWETLARRSEDDG